MGKGTYVFAVPLDPGLTGPARRWGAIARCERLRCAFEEAGFNLTILSQDLTTRVAARALWNCTACVLNTGDSRNNLHIVSLNQN
jgi:hypothetical protein